MAWESIEHCLVWCNFARSCWSILGIEGVGNQDDSFQLWFEEVLNNYPEKVELTAMLCWGIWKARNEVVWNKTNSRASTVVFKANAYLSQWRNVQTLRSTGSYHSVLSTGNGERWVKPIGNCVKVNCDASIFQAFSKFGVGWLARNNEGELIIAEAKTFSGLVESQCAEAIGIREALSWVKTEQDKSAGSGSNTQLSYVVESDCQVIVQAIKNAKTVLSPVGVVIADCLALLHNLKNVSIQFVKRSGNKAADFLASLSCSNPGCIARGDCPN